MMVVMLLATNGDNDGMATMIYKDCDGDDNAGGGDKDCNDGVAATITMMMIFVYILFVNSFN